MSYIEKNTETMSTENEPTQVDEPSLLIDWKDPTTRKVGIVLFVLFFLFLFWYMTEIAMVKEHGVLWQENGVPKKYPWE